MAPFSCTTFKPLIVFGAFSLSQHWQHHKVRSEEPRRVWDGGGGAVLRRQQLAMKELTEAAHVSSVSGQRGSPGPQSWHSTASPPAGSGAQPGGSRGTRGRLPVAALFSFACISSARAAGGGFAEATAGEATALAGCSVAALHPEI